MEKYSDTFLCSIPMAIFIDSRVFTVFFSRSYSRCFCELQGKKETIVQTYSYTPTNSCHNFSFGNFNIFQLELFSTDERGDGKDYRRGEILGCFLGTSARWRGNRLLAARGRQTTPCGKWWYSRCLLGRC